MNIPSVQSLYRHMKSFARNSIHRFHLSTVQWLGFLLLLLSTLACPFSTVFAESTAFTYQGRFNNNGTPFTGGVEFQFSLWDAASGGNPVGTSNSVSTSSSNGLFTATLDFGPGAFTGADRWLQVEARTTPGAFTTLTPRQQLTPTPYAITAGNASNLPGLIVQQNNSGAPNMIGGSPANSVSNSVVGATIAGGGATNYLGYVYLNSVVGDFGTVTGGRQNTAGFKAFVGGGQYNIASGEEAIVTGGQDNIASGFGAMVCGGSGNTASGTLSFAVGDSVQASGDVSFAAGTSAHATNSGSFVWSDFSTLSSFSSTTNNQFSIRAIGGARLVTGSAGLKFGPSGQYFAPGGLENLRVIRGVIDSAGGVLHGTGFTVTRTGTGAYTITFSSAFADFPAVTVSAQSGLPRMATTTNVGNGSAQIRIFDGTPGATSGTLVDAQFHFTAIGPQ